MMPRDDAPQPTPRRWDHPIIPAGLGILLVMAIALTADLLL